MPLRPSDDGELPPPTAELVLYRTHVEALIAVLPREDAERYLRLMGEKLALEENLSAVFHIRPTSERAAVQKARAQAAAIFDRLLPVFLARLPSGRIRPPRRRAGPKT